MLHKYLAIEIYPTPILSVNWRVDLWFFCISSAMKIKSILQFFLVLISFTVSAQDNIPIGTWRSHFSYQNTHLIEEVNDKIFAAAEHGLLFFDKEDNSLNKLSKTDGLSDNSASALAFDKEQNLLVIGYENGNVDLIEESGIVNVPAIKDSNVTGSKTINHVSFFASSAYLSTPFGIVVIDPAAGMVTASFRNLGPGGEEVEIMSSAFLGSILFLATEIGVLSADVLSGLLLEDFNNWTRYSGQSVGGLNVLSIASTETIVYAISNNSLFQFDQAVWSDFNLPLDTDEKLLKIRNSNDQVMIVSDQRIRTIATNGSVYQQTIEDNDQPQDAIIDKTGNLWYADAENGLTRFVSTAERFLPGGPLNADIVQLKYVDGALLAFPQLNTVTIVKASNGLGHSGFANGTWFTTNPASLMGLDNITDVIVREGGKFIGSFGSALFDQANGLIYDDTNSPLKELSTVDQNIIVTGLAVDTENNLWVANFSNTSLLKLDNVGDWTAKDFGFSASEEPMSLKLSAAGQLWMTLGLNTGEGVLAYNPATDLFRYLTVSSAKLPSNDVRDIQFDKTGDLWMATGQGIAFVPFAFAAIEDPGIDAIRPIFENGFLFDDKITTALEVDAGNRKWIGTHDGIWLFEENGDELVLHFNEANSPLPSDIILAIAIDPTSGEVFIATDRGLVSYRGDATEGESFHQNVKIFPNPVLPGFTGFVGFDGLASNAKLKITTISGRLVREIQAAGAGASWDVSDYNGKRAASGVYLVFSSNSDGSETFVGKIAIIE